MTKKDEKRKNDNQETDRWYMALKISIVIWCIAFVGWLSVHIKACL